MEQICSLCGKDHKSVSSTQVINPQLSVMFHLCDHCVEVILSQLKVPAQKVTLDLKDFQTLNKQFHKALLKLQGKNEKNKK